MCRSVLESPSGSGGAPLLLGDADMVWSVHQAKNSPQMAKTQDRRDWLCPGGCGRLTTLGGWWDAGESGTGRLVPGGEGLSLPLSCPRLVGPGCPSLPSLRGHWLHAGDGLCSARVQLVQCARSHWSSRPRARVGDSPVSPSSAAKIPRDSRPIGRRISR